MTLRLAHHRSDMLFRHRKQMRKHEKAHKAHRGMYTSDNLKNIRIGAAAKGSAEPENNLVTNVVFPTSYRYREGMSGKEVKMNKSHRVAMAQALLAELSEATARHGDGNEGVKRLHRMVRDMVAQLLA